ncbi:ABC-type Na+ efflux pump, permease component [Mizugakiibacter sediminis]|uniref:ABC-type Na+ efflux pump, permease component n=1 Tax=Mizugakiibacter sediminis TaxID=1475481 RepID=A0A0K8QJS0_9GAMM|nr:ABC transporter permease [Mizugakiibacter sediminis]GAP64951.1 ABC-type Na+ efflux pump, permease component [Mizugakiibacter sediminis]
MKPAWIVMLKEVRENLRDRRTVLNTLITGPLMAPLIFVLVFNTVVARELAKAEQPLPLPVVGAERAPNLIASLRAMGAVIEPGPADPERAVREQDADLVLRIPASYAESWRKGEPAQVELVYDASQRETRGPVERLQKMLELYGQRTAALRLVARGIAPTVTHPVVVAERDQSTPQSRAGILFAMLPYFFVLGAFIGGMALAIDTTAGERERQSLEPLLANPAPRWQILAGKLGATSAFATVTVLLSILAFAVAGHLLPTEKIGMALELGPRFTATTLLAMLPLVLLLAALQTLVSAFAKSHREAQTYLSLLMIVPALPSILLSILPVKAQAWMYAIPVVGQNLAITRLMRGDGVAAPALAACIAGSAVAAAIAIAVTARIYRSERLAVSA